MEMAFVQWKMEIQMKCTSIRYHKMKNKRMKKNGRGNERNKIKQKTNAYHVRVQSTQTKQKSFRLNHFTNNDGIQ